MEEMAREMECILMVLDGWKKKRGRCVVEVYIQISGGKKILVLSVPDH